MYIGSKGDELWENMIWTWVVRLAGKSTVEMMIAARS